MAIFIERIDPYEKSDMISYEEGRRDERKTRATMFPPNRTSSVPMNQPGRIPGFRSQRKQKSNSRPSVAKLRNV